MTVDLERQLSGYGEHVQSLILHVDVEEVLTEPVWRGELPGPSRRLGFRRLVGLAAAVVVLLLIGGVALLVGLFGGESRPVIDSPTTVTTQPVVIPEVTTPPPESTETSSPDTSVAQVVPSSPPLGRIAFVSDPDGILGGLDQELVVINADGTGRTHLADLFGGGDPAWSPDGTQVAFGTLVNGNTQTFVVGGDGTGMQQLTDITGAGTYYDWSPDGSRIALNGNDRLYVMNGDGSDLTRLSDLIMWIPVWSPNGNRIVFEADNDRTRDIYVINADGSGLTKLTDLPGNQFLTSSPWSPDSNRIVFHIDNDDRTRDIYVINADGSGLTRLTDRPGDHSLASSPWSPDGSRILFVTSITIEATLDSPERTELHQYLISPDGSNLEELELGDYWSGSRSPDGSKIAFRDLFGRLLVVSRDGSNVTLLTEELLLHPAYGLSWSPTGTHIAFSAALTHDEQTANYDIYVVAVDGSGITRLTTEPGNDIQPVWSTNP